MTTVAAVDFGATSIRVARVTIGAQPPNVEIVHRAQHSARSDGAGSLRWDWEYLMAETERGLDAALARGPLASIGVDTWGVDYGLIDAHGEVLSPPHSYRSPRTAQHLEVLDRIGRRRAYEIAGLQVQPFTTLFQLAAHDPDELARAAQLLLLPDLVVHALTGAVGTERTAAGTTGLLEVHTRQWSDELIDAVGVPRRLFAPLSEPGRCVGEWRGVPVHLVGSHDTASAAVSVPASTDGGSAFVASGTWLLVGREQPEPDCSPEAEADNFTNEQGVAGDTRFLRNITGFWMVEECRRLWGSPSTAALVDGAAPVGDGYAVFDASDPSLISPEDVEATVRDAADIAPDAPRAVVIRAIIESMAATTATVIDQLGKIDDVHLIGGGAGVPALHDALRRWTGRQIHTGCTEAAVVGNALAQGVALGVFSDFVHARQSTTIRHLGGGSFT